MPASRHRVGATLLCLLVLLGTGMAGCRSAPPVATTSGLPLDWITRVGGWPGPAEYRIELVTFHDRHNEQTHVARFDIDLSAERVLLAAQSTLGVPLFRLTLENGALNVLRQPPAPAGIEADRVLADFLLAAWPLAQLQPALLEAGYTIKAEGEWRRLLDRTGQPIVEIRGLPIDTGRTLQIVHRDIPLEVTIQTLQRQRHAAPDGGWP